jgi:predicted dehydrogenase
LPFAPEFAFAYAAIRDGRYGKLLGAQFKRTISDPAWLPDFYEPEKVGGPLVDLLIHDAHFLRLVCGMPRSVTSQGRMRGKVVEFVQSQFTFDDPALMISVTGGVIRQQGRAFTHAFEIQLEKATLLYDFTVLGGEGHTIMPLTVLDAKGKVQRPKLGAGDPVDGFVAELRETARAIRTGEPSPILSGELACDALRICQKQAQSVTNGRSVKI